MITTELEIQIRKTLEILDANNRSAVFVTLIAKLGGEKEFKEFKDVRVFMKSLPDELQTLVDYETAIVDEILMRKDWSHCLHELDPILVRYPNLTKRIKGIGYKFALAEFARECMCDVDFVCQLMEKIITTFESGNIVTDPLDNYWGVDEGPYRNDMFNLAKLMSCVSLGYEGSYSKRIWILKSLFLPEINFFACPYAIPGSFCVILRK